MSNEQEDRIVLEVSPVIDAEDYIELKYNLSAIMSGLSTSNCFQVEIDHDSFADVYCENNIFRININDRNYKTTKFASSSEEAMMIICGKDDDDDDLEDKIDKKLEELESVVKFLKSLTRNELSENDLYVILYKSIDLKSIFDNLIDI